MDKVDQMRRDKEEGKVRMQENSRYTHLWEEIEREHAKEAAKAAEDLQKANQKFHELERLEQSSVDKLKAT